MNSLTVERIEQPGRRVERHGEARCAVDCERAVRLVSAAHEQAAAKAASLGKTVDPCHRVLPLGTVLGNAEELIEIGDRERLDIDIGRADLLEGEFDPQDKPGQAKPADGGVEQLCYSRLSESSNDSRPTSGRDRYGECGSRSCRRSRGSCRARRSRPPRRG